MSFSLEIENCIAATLRQPVSFEAKNNALTAADWLMKKKKEKENEKLVKKQIDKMETRFREAFEIQMF